MRSPLQDVERLAGPLVANPEPMDFLITSYVSFFAICFLKIADGTSLFLHHVHYV
jgi:hypothetical protein